MIKQFEAGIFLIDKPKGVTSFGIVRDVRRALKIKKVGHAGTLDPFATGLLIVCAGRPATKMISLLMDGDKEYIATLCLGVQTETLDPEGRVVARRTVGEISHDDIETCLDKFRGKQLQVPPVYSALKHKGKPLYYYARKGIKITKEAREVDIKLLERLGSRIDINREDNHIKIRVVCSKGTYIRTLAADIGEKLGCGAYLTDLRRVRSGNFTVDKSVAGQEIRKKHGREVLLSSMLAIDDVCNLLH